MRWSGNETRMDIRNAQRIFEEKFQEKSSGAYSDGSRQASVNMVALKKFWFP
jgi:hypothetical protein